MKTSQDNLSLSVLTLAVRGALAAMAVMPLAAMADDAATAADQVNPSNNVEIGGSYTSQDSAKFGEYNGLDKKGFNFNGAVNLRGGDSYGQGLGTKRWTINATDLGTTSREMGATMSDQGKWSLGIDYDELRHNITDSYRTPNSGTLGGNSDLIPSSFGTINTTVPGGTLSGAAAQQVLTNGQLQSFHNQDVYSQRENTSFSAGYNIDRQWNVKFDYKHIDQSGSKLISSGTDTGSLDGYAYGGERVQVLLNPTKTKTDNFNLALNWAGDKGFFSAGYYGSLFHDDYNGLSFSDPFTTSTAKGTVPASGFPVDTMSTNPSNQFHQLNLTGGYFFDEKTKLVGGLSYAHNTQNESYTGSYTPGTYLSGPGSLDGKVDVKHVDLTLSNQTTEALNLSAGLKYNERDNKTASNWYTFYNLGGDKVVAYNTPESYRHTEFNLSGDYKIDNRQHIHAGYEFDQMKRWCDNSVTAAQINAQLAAAGEATTTYYNSGTDCMQVPKSREDRLVLNYMLRASDAVSLRAGYSYGDRSADINPSFYNPMQGANPGLEGFEYNGFVAYFQGSRKENKGTLSVDWQATDKVSLGLSGKYAKDDYSASLGVQHGEQYSVNLDANFMLSEASSIDAYVTSQHRTRDLNNDANGHPVDPLLLTVTKDWTNNLTDDDLMLGLGAKQKGLMGGRLDLSEDLTYSLGKTDYTTAAGAGFTCSTGASTNCGSFPTIKAETTTLKLTGSYKVDKASKVVLSYMYQHLNSNDPTYYQYYQQSYKGSTLPAYLTAPNYNQNVVFLAYDYSFK
jgi:MtrB/PioB family decaheme-associated outer membrane protein